MTPSNRSSRPKNGAGQPRQSSGKLPAHVYLRRRITLAVFSLVVVGLLVLGVVGIVKAVGGNGSGEEVSVEQPTAAEETSAAPVPDEKAASGKCPDDMIGLRAEIDPKKVKDGEQPDFGMVIENKHNATCLIEVGTEKQEFVVEKDGDEVWSSQYCAAKKDENAEATTEFAPQSTKTSKLKWNRIQVDKNCNKTNKDFAAGQYDLIVKLGDEESKPTSFELEKSAAEKAKDKKAADDKKKADEDEKESEKKSDEKSSDPQQTDEADN